MVDLVKSEIRVGDRVSPIVEFRVWFRTPFGLTASLPEAIAETSELGDSRLMIVAVPVAIGQDGIYEVLQ
jgi:hypothetical protein